MKSVSQFIACRKTKNAKLQHANMPHSIIYSICGDCGTNTSCGSKERFVEHYHYYQIVLNRERGEDWLDFWNRAMTVVDTDREKYLVTDFSDPVADARMMRRLKKDAKN